MKRDILKYPDPRLRRKAEPVSSVDEGVRELIRDMFETMYAEKGVGLAATQVGEPVRVVVLDVSPVVEDVEPFALVNPEIVSAEGSEEGEEGCLSVPDYTAPVKRAARVTVRALDEEGQEVEINAEGFLARALQHEIDHLDGILFVDRLSPVKKSIFRRKYAKIARSGVGS
ncbi:MAG: peptide deformylase [Deltaproteobacteria bacterium]|nr:MAG: peptide deformylase [Deltaproteobacteria bacterium]